MKNINKILIAFLIFFLTTINVNAKNNIKVYIFHGDGCPHCRDEIEFLDEIEDKYKNVDIKKYEVWYDKDNQKLMKKVAKYLNVDADGVPFTVIGNDSFVGFSDISKNQIEETIKSNIDKKDYFDVVTKVESNEECNIKKQDKNTSTMCNIPFIGKVDIKKVSIPLIAVCIGLVDGFNPCAMWVLLFLLSTLITLKDRKKMWILGFTFILTSGFVYMLIMLSWLKISVSISTSILIRNIIAVIAIIGALVNFYSYYKSKDSGCNIVDNKKRNKTFAKIKEFTKSKNMLFAVISVIALAISVNLVELACSAGLPLVFTQILAVNKVSFLSALIYTLIYILFFLIDDIIIFTVAMFTMKLKGISTKFTKYSHLIGGIIMLLIGVLLIFKPEWIMFNFK